MSAQAEPDWKSCSSRSPWVKNSLGFRAQELRREAAYCRKKYAGKFYADSAAFLADVFEEAAAIYERRLAEFPTSTHEGDTK